MPYATDVPPILLLPPAVTPPRHYDGAIVPAPTSTPPPSPPTPDFDDAPDHLHRSGRCPCTTPDNSFLGQFRHRHSPHSGLAKDAIEHNMAADGGGGHGGGHSSSSTTGSSSPRSPSVGAPLERTQSRGDDDKVHELRNQLDQTLVLPPSRRPHGVAPTQHHHGPPAVAAAMAVPAKHAPLAKHGSLAAALDGKLPEVTGASIALNDTPVTTAPSSPQLHVEEHHHGAPGAPRAVLPPPVRQNSGASTPRVRPTTLDIPGLTKSKVSPDGRIAQRDVGSKLVIVMVGLPARGKSYITKKLARYLNWLQHDTKIFNVGERRRGVAGGPNSLEKTRSQAVRDGERPSVIAQDQHGLIDRVLQPPPEDAAAAAVDPPQAANVAEIVLNGGSAAEEPPTSSPPPPTATPPDAPANGVDGARPDHERADSPERAIGMPDMGEPRSPRASMKEQKTVPGDEPMEQNSSFFDPSNQKASQIREQVARETLDELLDYILYQNGSVGILDATNSTLERRKMVMDRIRERAGPDLNVLFLESRCVDNDLLEANMRLKLNGPDYKDMDPTVALDDFKKRVKAYERAYAPLGDYEEQHNMPYIQMIDVGRKVISHQIKGFLMAQANYYLLNFNLAPRQIWITRHGLSMDNISGKIGGDSDLAPEGVVYARSLARFMDQKRTEWDLKQVENMRNTHFPPQPGDATPPNPYYNPESPTAERHMTWQNGGDATPSHPEPISPANLSDSGELDYQPKPFCVWTSMLKRSVQTAQFFNDEEYDTKQMRMLDELNAGVMEGLTYSCISAVFPEEYRSRKADKLQYRYPGPGGEGYLDIINRLRPVIVELERMTDHVLLVGHRSVARVLLAYFRNLRREEVADLDVPIGLLYCLEPKPYGVDFKVYKWDKATEWFYEQPNFELKAAEDDMK